MGVHGLWRLIEPSGKTVPLETLENKVLAVDISIWLHQAIKGFQDSKGAPLPNAHLLGIYHRVCKLLYFKIKPVFIFDGGVPVLKKQTIAKRNQLKSRNQSEADRLQKQLLNTLLKHSAISNVLSEKTKASIVPTKVSPGKTQSNDKNDLFALPSTSMDSTISSSDEELFDTSEATDDDVLPSSQLNIHNIDTASKEFRSLPADVRYEILSEVKDTRKQSSWGRLHQLPTQSDDFSSYQMNRLLQRQNVQNELEKTEKEIGGHSLSLAELESLMNDQGVITKSDTVGQRIAADENTRYLLIKDVKQAIEEAKQKSIQQQSINEEEETDEKTEPMDKEKLKALLKKKFEIPSETDDTSKNGPEQKHRSVADLEYEADLEKAIQLSLECVSENHAGSSKQSEEQSQAAPDETLDSAYTDEESDLSDEEILKKLSSAQSYMLEYSGLTPNEIAKILKQNCDKKKTHNKTNKNAHKKLISNKPSTNKTKESENEASIILQKLDAGSEIKVSDENDASRIKECVTEDVTENENPINPLKSFNIVINPNETIEDDLFSDVFGGVDETVKYKCKKDLKQNISISPKTSEIKTLDSGENITYQDVVSLSSTVESNDKLSVADAKKHSLEIIIDPKEAVEDDLFKDIFEDMMTPVNVCETANLKKVISPMNKHIIENVQEIGIISSDSEESDNDLMEVPDESNENITKELTPIKFCKVKENHSKEKIAAVGVTESCQSLSVALEILEKGESRNETTAEISQATNIIPQDCNERKVATEKEITDLQESHNKTSEDYNLNQQKLESSSNHEAIKPVTVESKSNSMGDDENLRTELENETINVHDLQTEQPALTVTQLQELQEDLRKEQFKLQTEKSLKERLAGNITDQMYQEAQDLLELFGVPYVVAPMEAEAQCAFLDAVNLTDGTITDDSDIWLFGGRTVYKNFFNQSKHVMEFRAENISHHFKLTREQMILLALLVGSDYTTGLQGIGPVTALEILAAFPPTSTAEFSLTHSQLLSGLAEFRSWFKKGKAPSLSRKGLRSKLKNVQFSENFPSIQVVEAYLDPKVDSSREPFTWAKPDIVGLIDFARQKFGWSITKSEEILRPVVKRLEEKNTQKTIRDYFKTRTRIISNEPENRMSKRVKTAVKRIGKEPVDEDEEKPKQKRSRKKKLEAGESSATVQTNTNEGDQRTSNEILDDINELVTDITETEQTKPTSEQLMSNKASEATIEEGGASSINEEKPKRRGRKKKTKSSEVLAQDEDVRILKATAARSSRRVEEINAEMQSAVKEAEIKKAKAPNLHKKEFIPQRERDKAMVMRNKLKAIELFRKSQQGPGYVKKRTQSRRAPKVDAELSEDSSDNN